MSKIFCAPPTAFTCSLFDMFLPSEESSFRL